MSMLLLVGEGILCWPRGLCELVPERSLPWSSSPTLASSARPFSLPLASEPKASFASLPSCPAFSTGL